MKGFNEGVGSRNCRQEVDGISNFVRNQEKEGSGRASGSYGY